MPAEDFFQKWAFIEENPYPSWKKPQMGNLNKDSTHPNPWYPPNQYQRMVGFAVPYKIFNGPLYQPEALKKPLRNWLEEDDLISSCWWAAQKSFLFGCAAAANDILVVNSIDTTGARIARFCYVVPPYVAMGISFVCAREALGNMSKEKNASWTYPAACIAPGAIYGITRNNFGRGIRFTLFSAVLAAMWKWNSDYGGMLNIGVLAGQDTYTGQSDWYTDIDHGKNKYKEMNAWGQGWRGWPFRIEDRSNWWTPREEPDWKKHVSPEEAERGPPTNL